MNPTGGQRNANDENENKSAANTSAERERRREDEMKQNCGLRENSVSICACIRLIDRQTERADKNISRVAGDAFVSLSLLRRAMRLCHYECRLFSVVMQKLLSNLHKISICMFVAYTRTHTHAHWLRECERDGGGETACER